jgi:hypothetical protein
MGLTDSCLIDLDNTCSCYKKNKGFCKYCQTKYCKLCSMQKNGYYRHSCKTLCCSMPINPDKELHRCICRDCRKVNSNYTKYCSYPYLCESCALERTKKRCSHCDVYYYNDKHICRCWNCKKEYMNINGRGGPCSECYAKERRCAGCYYPLYAETDRHACKCNRCHAVVMSNDSRLGVMCNDCFAELQKPHDPEVKILHYPHQKGELDLSEEHNIAYLNELRKKHAPKKKSYVANKDYRWAFKNYDD